MSTYPNATHISEHFTWAEFRVDPAKMVPADKRRMIDHCTLTMEPIRAHFKKPVHITEEGGYRSVEEQTAIYNDDLRRHGGKPSGKVARPGSSRHNFGDASDIWIEGVSPGQIALFASTLPHVGGIGIYPTFTHVDSRPIGAAGRPGKVIARW